MTIEIKIGADFVRHPIFPASENCERCFADLHKLCREAVSGLWDHCHYGQLGYWAFKGIKGEANG